MAGTGDLTPDERARVAPYVTDPEGPVFALLGLPEAVKGALFARYSRSANSVRRILLDEFVGAESVSGTETVPDTAVDVTDPSAAGSAVGEQRAREFFQRVLADYGDDSVAQLGGAHVAIEGVSNVLTKVIEWGRLASYLEQSTRYVPYTEMQDGRWKYVRPPGIAAHPDLLARYEQVLDDAFATYARLYDAVMAHLVQQEGAGDDPAVLRTLRARALDAVRGLLPAATTANLGVYASGQAWEQMVIRLRSHPLAEAREVGDQVLAALRRVIPDFLTRTDRADRGERMGAYRMATEERAAEMWEDLAGSAEGVPGTGTVPGTGVHSPAPIRLLEHDPDGERRVLAHALWPASGVPLDQVRARVDDMGDGDVRAALARWADGRADRRERPGRALEATSYLFEVTCDYGAYRDLQRHRILTLEAQPLGADLGFEPSPDVAACGLHDEFDRVQRASAALWREVRDRVPAEAPYAITMAHRIRFLMRMNAREAMHLIELRSQPQGHAAYRRVAQEMLVAIRDDARQPGVAALMGFADMSGDGDRLAQERRTEARRAADTVDS
ncbi:MAG: FAD-dependent thymidylate synthase [Thermoleophilia bacterium]|nr:FAD-dependent thymidylate synthase [Thermoleophilia bacterium]